MGSLNNFRDAAFGNSVNHGFHESPRSIGDDVALLASELSEFLEDARDGHDPNARWYETKTVDGDSTTVTRHSCQSFDADGNPTRKVCGPASELADVFVRLMDTCGRLGVDIDRAVAEKMEYNRTRPYRHGKKF